MAFPAVTDLVKGPIDESLKKLVQPAAIVPATVFLLLNLAIVYPRLLDANVGPAVAFKDLEDTWKGVILVVWILVSGYVLLNLNASMLRLATGELIAQTPIGAILRDNERRRISAVHAGIEAQKNAGKTSIEIAAMDMKLPPVDQAAPTRLGNVFNGANHTLIERYGFDIGALWIHLRTLLAADHKDLATAIDDERTPMEVLISLSILTVVFGIETAVLSLVTQRPADAGLLLLSLPVGYGLYRAACARADSYIELMKAAVDLYRSDLAKALGIDDAEDLAGERKSWRSYSRFYLVGEQLPESPPAAITAVKTVVPDNIAISATVGTRISPPVSGPTNGGARAQWIDRLAFLLAAKPWEDCCDEEVGTQVVFSAGGDWRFAGSPPITLRVLGAQREYAVLPGGPGGDGLIARLELRGRSSADIVLTYSPVLDLRFLDPKGKTIDALSAQFVPPPKLGDTKFRLALENNAAAGRKIHVAFRCDWAGTDPITFLIGPEDDPGVLTGRRLDDGTWVAEGDIPGGRTVLTIEVIRADPVPLNPTANKAI